MSSPHRTVITWVLGGLGNQLFQYAAGAALARRIGGTLLIDRSDFRRYPLRSYALDAFAIDTPAWSGDCPMHGVAGRLRRGRQWLANRGCAPQTGLRLLTERGYAWQDIPERGWNQGYLFGFWQSPRYFAPIEDELRRLFDPTRFLHPGIAEAYQQTGRPEAVAVHVRRGDYATNAQALAEHGLLDDAWYRQACGIMRQMVPGCHFHVFSDEPQVAARLFSGLADVTCHPVRTQEEDLLLLSHCRHKIIANSTFSWWAAWLGTSQDGVILAPRQWFSRRRLLTTPTVDLFPAGWLLV